MTRNRIISLAVAVVIGLFFGTGQFKDLSLFKDSSHSSNTTQRGSGQSRAGGNDIAAQSLPSEAQKVIGLIWKGGPFRYRKDGTVFQNREKRLPAQKRGYYREYTVRTPGASNRGARRIVAGGQNKKKPAVMYYTADHYETFKKIVGAQP